MTGTGGQLGIRVTRLEGCNRARVGVGKQKPGASRVRSQRSRRQVKSRSEARGQELSSHQKSLGAGRTMLATRCVSCSLVLLRQGGWSDVMYWPFRSQGIGSGGGLRCAPSNLWDQP